MFNTIRAQLLLILLLFIAVTLAASITLFNYFEKSKDSLSDITQKAERVHLLLLKDINISHDFIENETISPAFFITGKSKLSFQHDSIWKKIDLELDDLYQLQSKYNFGLGDSIAHVKSKFMMYKFLTEEIIKKILIRGFKDYGVEGKMRIFAHELENYKNEIGLINILQLRRHEKDFIIRQEDHYINMHQDLIKVIKEKLETERGLSGDTKYQILKTVTNYSTEFDNLVMYEKMLGLKSGKGLKKQIDRVSKEITGSLSSVVSFSAIREAAAISNIRFTYLTTGLAFIAIAILSSIFISRYVSKSLRELQREINEFVNSDFTKRAILKANKTKNNEITFLRNNFIRMEQHIVDQMNSLKKTNLDLETLFYITSHDMRLPLLKVKELTSETIKISKDPLAQRGLEQINTSWNQLIGIVDELGLITNVKHTVIKVEEIDLKELIRSVYSEFKGIDGYDDIIFSVKIDSKTKLLSSPGLIKSVLRNLIDNSIKYATKRASFSFLKIVVADQNADAIRIEVTDNGIGIKKDIQDQIFTMFFRGTEQARGAGIGLYVAQCAVEKLHGSITVESDGISGTSFTLILPHTHKIKTSQNGAYTHQNSKILMS